MSLHTPPSPSRGSLPMNTRNMLNHSQVGQSIGMSGRTNSMSSSGLGSPNRSSPSIICMPKQQPARQPFTIKQHVGVWYEPKSGFWDAQLVIEQHLQWHRWSENVTGLDLSDFPALADRSRREGTGNPTPVLNPLAGRAPYVGMVTKASTEQTQDFSIHNEDFPALPGPNYKDPSLSNDDAQNCRVTNIPSGMVTDQFGMIGLLTFIRAAETDPGMVHLALGSDLTTLGLNLNSPENLYPKFASPGPRRHVDLKTLVRHSCEL
ncbi:hypothetical protein KUCAC02_021777 [Chaenocephalus aceratus]|uniref:Uncharacterized protein n=1 Tax=Chaenocephalus aceratus TaxID=36190 RepID=A0ACB9XI80_CHAAC|nr:hypothetical protein KUCAC02_021777 [Chaenocephalus aceratus]